MDQPTVADLMRPGATVSVHLNVEVPAKLSDWLRLALRDAATSKAEGARLNMAYWLGDNGGGACAVCLAGAVMLQCLPDDLKKAALRGKISLGPSRCNGHDRMADKLHAINAVRAGSLESAIKDFYGHFSAEASRRLIAPWEGASLPCYDEDFVQEMKARIDWLAERGL